MNNPRPGMTGVAGAFGSQDQNTSPTTTLHAPSTLRAHEAMTDSVAVLVTETLAGHTRRLVYLSLDAALAASDRAAQRGNLATVVVCRLVPLDGREAQQ